MEPLEPPLDLPLARHYEADHEGVTLITSEPLFVIAIIVKLDILTLPEGFIIALQRYYNVRFYN